MTTTRQPAVQGALFGDDAPAPAGTPQQHGTATQDVELVAGVVRTATDPGYVLVGPTDRVYRIEHTDPKPAVAVAVPRFEADTVTQLLDARHLTTGGTHTVSIDRATGPATSILVPKATRAMVTRWASLQPLPTPRSTPDPVPTLQPQTAGAAFVDVVEPGKALVTLDGTDHGGLIRRTGNRYHVENTTGTTLGTASSYRRGAHLIARHHDYQVTDVVIEHEHRTHTRH